MARSVVSMDRQGRLVVPASLRRQLDISPGEPLLAWIEDGRLVLASRQQAIESVRALFAEVAPERSLTGELLAERQSEAAREAKD